MLSEERFRELEQRFWSKVKKTSDCWWWTGGQAGNYGQFWVGNHQARAAHRVAYKLLVGPIPDGLTLDHLCRNKLCVNPSHLQPVTNQINVLRGVGPTAINFDKTHCPNGHPYDIITRRRRRCRRCRNENRARRLRERRQP